MPAPGVPTSPGDKVTQDANDKIASGLDSALKEIGDAIDKATECSFGRACSEDIGDNRVNQPNIGKDLTDAEKAELGGTGSGTPGGWEPQDEEKARNKETNSSTPSKYKLEQAASSPNRNGLTDAGRALQKHGGREGTVYSYSSQKASILNQEAQSIVNEILSNPNAKIEKQSGF